MRLARELTTAAILMIVAYLVLEHFTGFTKDVGQIGESGTRLVKAFQGR